MKHRPIEIFWGTGGVGKTTLAASRALFLSAENNRVLLITIDPSKRLKQIFDIENESMGKIIKVSSFDLLIFTPEKTFKRILDEDNAKKELGNRIMNILMQPYGGMNEIMAIVEIQHQLKNQTYDTIILDTPPGEHFVDFVKGVQKINKFFDKRFIEIIKYLASNAGLKNKSIFNLMAKTGMDTIFKYMKMVTGEKFMEEFIGVLSGLHNNKEIFLSTLDFEKKLQEDNFCHWFLIASIGRNKLKEIIFLQNELDGNFHCDECLIVNKSIKSYIDNWSVEHEDELYQIKKTMKEEESHTVQLAKASFKKVLVFPEILSSSPRRHIEQLSQQWRLP